MSRASTSDLENTEVLSLIKGLENFFEKDEKNA